MSDNKVYIFQDGKQIIVENNITKIKLDRKINNTELEKILMSKENANN